MSDRHLAEIGHHLASRTRARELREELLSDVLATQQPCRIDLTDVLSISDSFADEFFAVLAEKRGDEWFRRYIQVSGASDVVRGAIVRAIGARLARPTNAAHVAGPRGFELAPPPAHLR